MSAVSATERSPRQSAWSRVWSFLRHHVLTVYAWLAFVYLMLPIAIVIAFSFNDPAGRFNYTWSAFTFDN
jgi:ABC-type spermidine/putrescine transport system permease subunit II